jgi:hypothetical protein
VSVHESAQSNDLRAKLEDVTGKYEAAEQTVQNLTRQLDIFQKEKETAAVQRHRDEIDAKVKLWGEKIGKYSGYLEYCLTIDYTKKVEEIEKEFEAIHYESLQKGSSFKRNSFAAIETVPVGENGASEDEMLIARYGAEITKHLKDKK